MKKLTLYWKGIDMKAGDEVRIHDGSYSFYSFGIYEGEYSESIPIDSPLWVKAIGMCTQRDASYNGNGEWCDVLVTDKKGNYWFVPSRFIVAGHTITIDGKDIEISHESYLSLKEQLT